MEISEDIRELVRGMDRGELEALVLEMLETESIPDLPLDRIPLKTDPDRFDGKAIAERVSAIADDDSDFEDSYGEYGFDDRYPNEHAYNIMMQGMCDAFYDEADGMMKAGDTAGLNSLLLAVAAAFRDAEGALLEHDPEAGRDIADSIEDCVRRRVPMDAFLY